MKELSIEEKAKRYDEALKYAMIYYKEGNEDMKMMMKTCFPILVEESEDERIRKALIEYFNEQCDMSDWNGVYGYQVVSWLEKQGQTFTKKDVDDAYLKGVCDTKHELEKQGEQNPVPKFNVGDTMRTLQEAWDAEKKELKKIEQTSVWSTKDCQMIEEILFLIEEYRKSNRCTDEEDMQNSVTCEDWLKSLKERVVPQPKQKWNEVDEEWLTTVIGDYNFNRTSNNDAITQIKIDWLKSLKDRFKYNQAFGYLNADSVKDMDRFRNIEKIIEKSVKNIID